MNDSRLFDAELLRRYDRPGPRYTSYPTAPHFHAGFGEAALRQHMAQSNEDPIPRQLSLYVHIPFCESPCFYCGCNRVITRDKQRGLRYLEFLRKEMALLAPLIDQDREVVQLHLGGGTPNFLPPALLAGLMDSLAERFPLSWQASRDYSIELDPRSSTPADATTLVALGFNRVSLGVQDFDPAVQQAVNRVQGVEATLALMRACQSRGLAVNVDLIYGLPKQSLRGFATTLDIVIAARPERLAIYSYAHLPQLFRPQNRIHGEDLPSADDKLALLALAIQKLTAAGYVYIGLDHFARPDDALAQAQRQGRLQRNFMGYTTHADTDLLGLGVSAISHVAGSYSQNARDIAAWEAALEKGRLPVVRGLSLNEDDALRAALIQQLMCQGRIDIPAFEKRHALVFAAYFADALAQLAALANDGLVECSATVIHVTPRGRLLLRVIAACFDQYLAGEGKLLPFSRAV